MFLRTCDEVNVTMTSCIYHTCIIIASLTMNARPRTVHSPASLLLYIHACTSGTFTIQPAAYGQPRPHGIDQQLALALCLPQHSSLNSTSSSRRQHQCSIGVWVDRSVQLAWLAWLLLLLLLPLSCPRVLVRLCWSHASLD